MRQLQKHNEDARLHLGVGHLLLNLGLGSPSPLRPRFARPPLPEGEARAMPSQSPSVTALPEGEPRPSQSPSVTALPEGEPRPSQSPSVTALPKGEPRGEPRRESQGESQGHLASPFGRGGRAKRGRRGRGRRERSASGTLFYII